MGWQQLQAAVQTLHTSSTQSPHLHVQVLPEGLYLVANHAAVGVPEHKAAACEGGGERAVVLRTAETCAGLW